MICLIEVSLLCLSFFDKQFKPNAVHKRKYLIVHITKPSQQSKFVVACVAAVSFPFIASEEEARLG